MKLKSRIMHKGTRGHEITERQQRINVAISKIRYKVERTFGSMHRWFGAGIARYVGLSKHMRSILWNPLPTTYTERQGLLCQILSDNMKIHR